MKRILFGIVSLLLTAKIALADTTIPGEPAGKTSIELTNPLGTTTFGQLLQSVITYAIEISVPILTIMFLWGGFVILTAGGDKAKYEQGKTILKNGAIGMVVVLAAGGIIYIIGGLLGVDTSKFGI